MSRLPQGCATFTRLVFILDLGGRGYEPGGERASSAKAFVRMLGGRRSRFLVDSSHRPGLLNNSLEVCRHSNRTGGKREERAGRHLETCPRRFQAKPDEGGGSKVSAPAG